MPIQSGVSVTVSPHSRDPGLLHASKRRPSKEGLDKVSRIGCSIADISAPQRRLYWNLRTKTPTTTTSLLRRRVARLRNWRRSGKPSLNLSLRDIDWMITAWFRLFRLQAGGEPSSCGKCLSHFGIVRHAMHGKSSALISLDLILERQKSSGGTSRHNSVGQQPSRPAPSTHTSVLPAREAALNQAQHAPGAPLARHRSQPIIHHPAPTADPDLTPPQQTQHPPEPSRRRTQANVLGGGFLRPLTRVGEPSLLGRTQSTAALQLVFANEPPSPSPLGAPEAPAMIRRSTDGDGRASSHELRRRELARRSETMDTSYRSHGW